MLKLIFSLSTLWWMILLLYIPACFGLIIIVLLQKGKGQGLAGAFGMGGGSDTIFGPRSSKSLPQKITYASAAIFMCLALIMSILSGKVGRSAAPDLVEEAPEVTMDAFFDEDEEAPQATAVTVTDEEASTVPEGIAAPAADAPSLEDVAIEEPVVEVSDEETPAEDTAVESDVEETPVEEILVDTPVDAVEDTAPEDTEAPAETPVEVSEETPTEVSEETPAEAPEE